MESWLSEQGTGTTFAAVSGQFLRSIDVVLAPLNEQKRIADKLDAVLARVDTCRDRLVRIPAILKRFRQSVLAAATSGKLADDWRAEQTIVSHSTAWQIGTLANLLVGKPRNGYSPRAVEYPTSVKSLTLTATTSGRFKGEHFKYIDEEIPLDSHLWLQPGDILIQRANTLESVGISAVYDGPSSIFIYPDLMMKAKANDLVETKFLHYLLLSEPVRRHFRDNATGTAGNMPKINQATVLSAPVTWPSREEQTEIVRRVESLFAFADRLEARYTAARAQVEQLTPATLAKAFRGELVPQDPNDVPASVLLERIKPARVDGAIKPKRARTTDSVYVSKKLKEKRNMTKSRQDDDVRGQPYLAAHLRKLGGSAQVESLFDASELPVTDFYKQLAWEVSKNMVRDAGEKLELGDAA